MKAVTVYRIAAFEETTEGDVFEFAVEDIQKSQTYGLRCSPYSSRGPSDHLNVVFTRFAEPVHRIRKPDGTEVSVAVSPEIRDMLQAVYEAPIRRQVDALLERASIDRSNSKAMSAMLGEQITRIERFLGMSLWGRLKYAWRCDFPGVSRG